MFDFLSNKYRNKKLIEIHSRNKPQVIYLTSHGYTNGVTLYNRVQPQGGWHEC